MWNPIWFFVSAVYPTISLVGVFGIYLLLESRARRAGRPQGAREENMKKIFNYILPAWFLQSVLMIIWAIFKDGFVHALPGICILLLIALMIAISLSRQEWLQTIGRVPLPALMSSFEIT